MRRDRDAKEIERSDIGKRNVHRLCDHALPNSRMRSEVEREKKEKKEE